MPRSRAGWKGPCSPNNNHAREGRILIHTSPFSANAGKQAATISLSCTGNSWPVATPTRRDPCISSWFACCQKDGRSPTLPICLRALLCLHDKRFSCFFVEPPKLSGEERESLLLLRQFHRRAWIWPIDRKSTRLNSSHPSISYAV